MNIALATLSTPDIERYAALTAANKKAYCQRHSYSFVDADDRQSDRYPAWDKVLLLQEHLSSYEWILWTDADSLITNPSVELQWLLNHDRDIVISADGNGLNTGVFLIRNCDWSFAFLKEVWRQMDLINHPWWEQAAFQRLYPLYANHFKVVPQTTFNSDDGNWRLGHFILHLPGTSTAYRWPRLNVVADVISQSSIDWQFTLADRGELPKFLNSCGLTGEAVEVGVASGDFAEHIIRRWPGRQLHLVDPWRQLSDYRDIANVADVEHERRYQRVRQRMLPFGNRATQHRELSQEAVKRFSDQTVDCVYIDANHAKEAVYADLMVWYEKIKEGGVLAGHDYLDGMLSEGDFGVESAVTQFSAERGLKVHRTLESKWPSFLIFKGNRSEHDAMGVKLLNLELCEGDFLFRRIGESRKEMTFCLDGTVGKGGSASERYWRLDRDWLTIFGQSGEVLQLVRDPGGVYRGRCSQTAIELLPIEQLIPNLQEQNLDRWAGEFLEWGEGMAVDCGRLCSTWTNLLAVRYREVVTIESGTQVSSSPLVIRPANVNPKAIAALDNGPKVELIKIDADESDLSMWTRLVPIVARDRPALIAKIYNFDHRERILSTLRELAYRYINTSERPNANNEGAQETWLLGRTTMRK